MRIAVWHHLPSGGGKRALYHHVKGLVAHGHTVEAWCPASAERTYLPLTELVPEHRVPYEAAVPPAWPWKRLPVYQTWKRRYAALDEHCRACAEEISSGGFDVLFAGNCIDSAVAPIARHVPLPSLLYHGEPNRSLYEARPTLPWIAPPEASSHLPIWRRVKEFCRDWDALTAVRTQAREERASVAAFSVLLVNSAYSRESVLRTYGLDAKVCYLGIDTELFRPCEGGRERVIVGLGAIQPHKGIDVAIEALATVPAERRPKLIWIGNVSEGEYEAAMMRLAAQRQVSLEFTKLISDLELVKRLGQATAMIYTSRLEPFGFSPLEANACGTPVVAVAEGGVRESIRDRVNGLLVSDRDPVALGAALDEVLTQPELARSLGQAGAEVVRKMWTWNKSVDQLEEQLTSIAAKH